jgi:hypothetical protein
MQLFPFVCGLASIPVMAALLWRITRSEPIALLAAALTALNPMLAHYTVFVKAYSVDFLMTAILLYVVTPLLIEAEIRPAAVLRLLLLSALTFLVSATSVFISLPALNIVALRALFTRQRQLSRILLPIVTLDALGVLGALWFRFHHYGGIHAPYDFYADFLVPLSHPRWLWMFLKHRLLGEISRGLPNLGDGDIWNPDRLKWPLTFAGIGLGWLLVRRSTRGLGILLFAILAGFLVATYTNLYPLTTARRSIFSFPIVITLAALSVDALTAWSSRRRVMQFAVGLLVAAIAVVAPIRVAYWDVDDARLVTRLSTALRPSDGLILSPSGTYLTAYYGPWRVNTPSGRGPDGTGVSIVRLRTLQLPSHVDARAAALRAFFGSPLPNRICYVAFRTDDEEIQHVLAALNDHGYATEVAETTTRGKLYVGQR